MASSDEPQSPGEPISGKDREGTGGDAEGESSSSIAPELVSQILKGDGEKEKVFREVFGLFMGPTTNPVSQKITTGHIDKVLDNERDQQEKSHSYRMAKLWFDGGILIVILVFILALAYLFRDQPQIVVPLMTGVGGFLMGVAGGFGLAKSARR